MKKNISLILSLIILIINTSCKEKIKDSAIIASSTGNVTITRGAENIFAHTGDSVLTGDIIKTDSRSLVDIYVGKESIVRVYPDTNLTVTDHIFAASRIFKTLSLTLSSGQIYIHIGKLLKENSMMVKTPTTIVAVRGTRFYVTAETDSATGEKKSETGVIEGKVSVSSTEGNKIEKSVSENNAISVTDNGNVIETAITAEQSGKYSLQNSEMDEKTNYIDLKGTTEGIKSYNTSPDLLVKDKKVSAAPPVALKTEAQIKQYYHKLETITLDDDTILIGAVIEQTDKTVKIHTTNGILTLPTSSVVEIKIK